MYGTGFSVYSCLVFNILHFNVGVDGYVVVSAINNFTSGPIIPHSLATFTDVRRLSPVTMTLRILASDISLITPNDNVKFSICHFFVIVQYKIPFLDRCFYVYRRTRC